MIFVNPVGWQAYIKICSVDQIINNTHGQLSNYLIGPSAKRNNNFVTSRCLKPPSVTMVQPLLRDVIYERLIKNSSKTFQNQAHFRYKNKSR